MTALAPMLQAFFTDRLVTQRHASSNTIAAYRDTFKLLMTYVQGETGKTPAALDISDLDATRIGGFLTHLKASGATVRAPATPASRRSIRCSPTPRCSTPSMPTPSPGSSRFPKRGPSATSLPGSPTPR